MSCGKPHAHDCAEILAQLYLFLDHEMDDASCTEIAQHLEECHPCLEKYDLDRIVKALVQRSCSEEAPPPLRERVLFSIREVQVQIGAPVNMRIDRPH
ncbi:MAG: mycothiol system anti-sigma-R factor [Nocardioidaceae bacterium]